MYERILQWRVVELEQMWALVGFEQICVLVNMYNLKAYKIYMVHGFMASDLSFKQEVLRHGIAWQESGCVSFCFLCFRK